MDTVNSDSLCLGDFPCVKRPRFDEQFKTLSFAERRKFVLRQTELYREFNIDYIAEEPKSAFELFKDFSNENPKRDDTFLSQFPFDPETVEDLSKVMLDQVVFKRITTAHERLLSTYRGTQIWYNDLYLDLNFFEEIGYSLPNFTVKFKDLDYLKHMMNACCIHMEKINTSDVATPEDAAFFSDIIN
jgi:hypothetical protein